MNNKPLLNAFGAAVYVMAIATLMQYLSSGANNSPDTWIVPVMMLGLFTLSAAVMAYLFLSEPVRLYFENKKSEAAGAFLQTLLYFAGFVVVSVATYLLMARG